jgi:hypothetical protein
VACPSSEPDYPFRYVYYEGMSDGRGCTTCSCSGPAGTTCSYAPGVLPVFSYGSGCTVFSGNPYVVPAPCTGKVPSDLAFGLGIDAGIEAGGCTPSGGQPDGSVVPTTATTLCCSEQNL